jgi:hypothetical protein
LAGIFAAVPATVAAGLAYRGETFGRRMSRGPRFLLSALSVQAAWLAVTVGLRGLSGLAEWSGYAISIYSLFAALIFLYIQIGPRWRKNERSRMSARTRMKPPSGCRRYQSLWAFTALVLILFVTLSAAFLQLGLRQEHLLHGFPGTWERAWVREAVPAFRGGNACAGRTLAYA